jgi:hypothetical protein
MDTWRADIIYDLKKSSKASEKDYYKPKPIQAYAGTASSSPA